MTNAAVQVLFPETFAEHRAVSEFGFITARSGRIARVTTSSGERDATIAASCLISPATGDRVLVTHAGEDAYVLAVLEQHREGETRLVFDQDVSFSVLKGKLRILAQEGVELMSPQALHVHVADLTTDARNIHISFKLLNLVGKSIASKTQKVRVVADTVDTIAGRIYERTINFFRRTEELDRVEAKNMDLRAEQLLHVHGENAVTTAEHLVKIDAGQVHVG